MGDVGRRPVPFHCYSEGRAVRPRNPPPTPAEVRPRPRPPRVIPRERLATEESSASSNRDPAPAAPASLLCHSERAVIATENPPLPPVERCVGRARSLPLSFRASASRPRTPPLPALETLHRLRGAPPSTVPCPQSSSSIKSRNSGLMERIRSSFFLRRHDLICFSRSIASKTSSVSSQ